MKVVVSIVSHGHGLMLSELVRSLLSFPEVSQIVLTYNIPETSLDVSDDRLIIRVNPSPKGFGANHNAAFKACSCDHFCVLNPDITFEENPFPVLLSTLEKPGVGLAAPLIVGDTGIPEDSMRQFLTPIRVAKRLLGTHPGVYETKKFMTDLYPDWVAGMFMVFNPTAFKSVGGFDERYFMYCEDADICTKLWRLEYKIVGCLSVSVIHHAQRASRKFSRHLAWHITSLMRYFFYHILRMPRKSH